VRGPILCRAGAAASLSSNLSRRFAFFAGKNALVDFGVSCVFGGHALVDSAPSGLLVAARRLEASGLITAKTIF
jgi:hypothetical protein